VSPESEVVAVFSPWRQQRVIGTGCSLQWLTLLAR